MRHRTFFVVAHPRLEDANRRKTPKQSPSHATSSHVKYEIKTNKPFHRPLSQTARPEHQSSSRTVSDRTRCDGRPRRRSPGGRRQPRHARETVLLLNVQNGPAPNTFSERSQRPPFSVSGRLDETFPSSFCEDTTHMFVVCLASVACAVSSPPAPPPISVVRYTCKDHHVSRPFVSLPRNSQ